jgi:hypothetical protein
MTGPHLHSVKVDWLSTSILRVQIPKDKPQLSESFSNHPSTIIFGCWKALHPIIPEVTLSIQAMTQQAHSDSRRWRLVTTKICQPRDLISASKALRKLLPSFMLKEILLIHNGGTFLSQLPHRERVG